jgi:hypothetical protein
MAGYPSRLALCVIDSIQSTEPHYTSVRNVLSRYCGYGREESGNSDSDGALMNIFDGRPRRLRGHHRQSQPH